MHLKCILPFQTTYPQHPTRNTKTYKFITPSLVARNKIEKWTEKTALVRKRDKSPRSEPAIFSAAPWACLTLDSKYTPKPSTCLVDIVCLWIASWFCMQHFCWMRENKTFDHIEAKCNPRHSFHLKDLVFLFSAWPKNILQNRQSALLISTFHDASNLEHIFQNNPKPSF